MIEAAIYKALGDPIRLEIVQRLASTSTSTVGELSSNLGISRQGARKQLQVLVDANVVQLERYGRQIHASLDAETLKIAELFISKMEQQWISRLEALRNHVEE